MEEKFDSNPGDVIEDVVRELCRDSIYHSSDINHFAEMPSIDKLNEVMYTLRGVLFPGYYGDSTFTSKTLHHRIGASIDRVYHLLSEQILRGFCFECINTDKDMKECQEKAEETALGLIKKLPYISKMLSTDVQAAYRGDPAAKSTGETIFCYPSIRALVNYRVAHELYKLEVPLISRILTEMAHSETGIDIHPGADIGEYFFMDHGTGIVIGETCIIGRNVRVYQGVTLGAKSFPLDKDGNPVKGIPRHPIVEDDVIIYSGATILGRVRIGKGSVIGGNVWITKDVPPGSRIVQYRTRVQQFMFGEGI